MFFIYISVGVFLTGFLMLFAFSFLTEQTTLAMYIISSFFIVCGIFMTAFFRYCWKSNSKQTPVKQELIPRETDPNVETL